MTYTEATPPQTNRDQTLRDNPRAATWTRGWGKLNLQAKVLKPPPFNFERDQSVTPTNDLQEHPKAREETGA